MTKTQFRVARGSLAILALAGLICSVSQNEGVLKLVLQARGLKRGSSAFLTLAAVICFVSQGEGVFKLRPAGVGG